MWADYLWTSGGKLQLSKCFYFAFKPNYKTNQVSYIKFTTDVETYTIKNPTDNSRHTLTGLLPDDARRTLGAVISPLGNSIRQL